MEVPASGAPIALDPLIAEARRRRRWLLVAVAIGLAAGAVAGVNHALLTPSHRLTAAPNRRLGIARIPGLTMLSSGTDAALCIPFRAGPFVSTPSMGDCSSSQYDPGVFVGANLDQVWVLKPAVATIGEPRLRRDSLESSPGLRWPIAYAGALPLPATLVRQHPGPAEVQVRIRTGEEWNPLRGTTGWAGSPDAAKALLHSGLIGKSVTDPSAVGFTPLPNWAINGGLAGRLATPWNDAMSRFQFAWVAGTRAVFVDVLGTGLTVREAQRVAALAGPSSG